MEMKLNKSITLYSGLGALQYTGLNPVSNILRTPGVENIEKRYSAGGGSKNHLPGAATPLGNHDAVDGNVQKHQGVGSEKFLNSISDQKPDVSGSSFCQSLLER